jgi:hypothetical protein
MAGFGVGTAGLLEMPSRAVGLDPSVSCCGNIVTGDTGSAYPKTDAAAVLGCVGFPITGCDTAVP